MSQTSVGTFAVARLPSLLGMIAGLGLGACAHERVLQPQPGTALAAGTRDVAISEVAGVQVAVDGSDWSGDPSNLTEGFMPVRVTLDNHSGRTLRISYRDFNLQGGTGFRYAALPPVRARQKGAAGRGTLLGEAAYQPAIVYTPLARQESESRFFVAPYMAYAYPGLTPWGHSFPYDPSYTDQFYASWPDRLPTRDMLAKAIPEGAVENNGRISGFIYFQSARSRESAVEFDLSLVDMNEGQAFGQVKIPFAVRK